MTEPTEKSFYGCLYDAAEEVTVPRQSTSSDNLSDFNLYKDKLVNGDPTLFDRVYKAFERVALPLVSSNESLQSMSMSPRSSSPRLSDMNSQDDLTTTSSSNNLFRMFERAASQNNLYNSSNNLEFLAATSGEKAPDEGENKQQLLYRLYYAFEAFLENYNDSTDEEDKMDNKFMDKIC